MRKILFIVSTLKHSGTIIQIFNIAKYLDPEKYNLFVITLSPEEEGSILKKFEDIGAQVNTLNLSRIATIFAGKGKLESMVNKINPDIIHTQGIRSDSFSVSLAKNFDIVSSMQNYPFSDYPMFYGKLRGTMMARRHLAIIKKRKNFIACSKSVAREFNVKNDVTLAAIQNGVDTEIFYPVENDVKQNLKNKLHLPLDKKIFICVGALIPRKDMETIIKAYNGSNHDATYLVIAGSGDRFSQISKGLAANKSIKLLGNIKNVYEFMQASDYFISASWAEGLPNTVLEAMACGLPVILSDIEPHKEVFEASDDYPYFFEIKDSQKLSQLIEKMIVEDYQSHSESMLKIIQDSYTARMMSGKYEKLYEKILQNYEVRYQ